MIEIAFIRHGVTDWNRLGRLQGRADIPLSPEGRAALAGRRPPAGFEDAACYVSPLLRARETAALLGFAEPVIEPAIIEMDWGAYEGRTIADLRADPSVRMAENEARGLDMQPPGGESPRTVLARVAAWLGTLHERHSAGTRLVAVSHKGIIRVLLAGAARWDMTGKPPARLDWRAAHVVGVQRDGSFAFGPVNQPLKDAASSSG